SSRGRVRASIRAPSTELGTARARQNRLRTRGSWVQVLPGAPEFKWLRAASEVVSRPAGPLPDLLSTALILPRSRRAERCVSLADLPTVINCGKISPTGTII